MISHIAIFVGVIVSIIVASSLPDKYMFVILCFWTGMLILSRIEIILLRGGLKARKGHE